MPTPVATPVAFESFAKIARWTKVRFAVVTEKIDGTNAQVYITDDGELLVGSRNRWITPDADNFGFARWCQEHRDELLKLGPGRHFGEWWGSGIQRGYGLTNGEKRFTLFNVGRWEDGLPTDVVSLVPVLWKGPVNTLDVDALMADLGRHGSVVSPGFPRPEGVIVYYHGTLTKRTFDDEHKGLAVGGAS